MKFVYKIIQIILWYSFLMILQHKEKSSVRKCPWILKNTVQTGDPTKKSIDILNSVLTLIYHGN